MELGVYQRKNALKDKKHSLTSRINELIGKINFGKIAYLAVIFLAAKANALEFSLPFGAAMYAVEFTGGIPFVAGILVLLAAWLAQKSIIIVLKYTAALLIFSLAAKKLNLKSNVQKGICMSVAVMIAGAASYIAAGLLFYDVMMLVLEGLITFAATYLFARAKTLIFTSRMREAACSEDIVALTALAAVTIMGAGRIEVAGIGISGCLCVLTTLLFAYENGAVIGAASGITIGVIYGFYSEDVVGVLGAFALASMLAGFFSKYGRSGSALGFLFANSLVTFYAVGTSAMLVGLGEVAAGSLIFTLMPQRAVEFFNMTGERRRSHTAKMKEYTYMSLMENSQAVSEVAEIYSNISENKLLGTQSAASSFFEKTARKLCDGCSLKPHCWRREFHRTYTSFFVMLELCGKKGRVENCDIPVELTRKCSRKDKIAGVFNNMYEVYKVDRLWETRATEGRNMAAKQMECVGAQIARLAKNSKGGFMFDAAQENNIKSALNENKIAATAVLVCSERGNKKIDITLQTAGDTDKIEKIINSCTGEEYKLLVRVGNRLRYFKREGLRVSMGKMCMSKDNNAYNGDTAGWEHLENGRFLMMLSDGMGSGERASGDSHATVEIAKRLMRCGFDAESALAIINSVLVLKSAETSFATVDMGLIDLKKGEMEFYKLGAAQSFIKRGNDVKTISSASLPAGVFGDSGFDRTKVKLFEGDTVIMVSDGIIGTEDENPLKEAIAAYDGTNPQDIAAMIIDFARKEQADIINDDMTVVVARLDDEEAW